jgi:hypothetical protein
VIPSFPLGNRRSSAPFIGAVCLLVVLTAGCAPTDQITKGPDPLLAEAATTHKGALLRRLGSACYARQVALEKRLKTGKARPVQLVVRVAPQSATQAGQRAKPLLGGAVMLGTAFAKSLLAGQVRSSFIVGLAGTGKSSFAETLDSRLCERVPTIRIHAQRDILRHDELLSAANPVLASAGRGLGLKIPTSEHAASHIRDGLGNKPWLLILDGLDEIPPKRKLWLLAHAQEAVQKAAKMRLLVLVRPPLYRTTTLLPDVRGVLELVPQAKADIDEALTEMQRKDRRLVGLTAFIAEHRLTRLALYGGVQHYRQLMTWRDLSMTVDLFKARRDSGVKAKAQPMDGSRAALFEAWVRVQLVAALQDGDAAPKTGQATPAMGIATVAAMIDAQRDRPEREALALTPAACETAAKASGLASKGACAMLLGSSLFVPVPGTAGFGFANRSLYDWFVARGFAASVAGKDCTMSAAQHRMLESTDVASFLLGMPQARKCVVPTLRALCHAKCSAADLHRTVDRGLAAGAARVELLAVVRKGLNLHDPVDQCVSAALASAPGDGRTGRR